MRSKSDFELIENFNYKYKNFEKNKLCLGWVLKTLESGFKKHLSSVSSEKTFLPNLKSVFGLFKNNHK